MPKPTYLSSAANPRIKGVSKLRQQRLRRRSNRFVAEGVREVSRAIEAGLTLRELFICEPCLEFQAPSASHVADVMGHTAQAEVYAVTPALMRKMAYRQEPEGILGVFDQPQRRLEDLLLEDADAESHAELRAPGVLADHSVDTHRELWLVAVGVQKPGNLGAMARTAEAAGCRGLLVADGVVDPYNPNTIRASTGAVFSLPVVGASASEVLDFLDERRARVVIASPNASTAYTEIDLTGRVAIVIGPEDRALDWPLIGRSSPYARSDSAAPVFVSIPMLGGSHGFRVVDSLNASVAAAVVLFEAVRQQGVRD